MTRWLLMMFSLTVGMLPVSLSAESRFELQEVPGKQGVREFVLIHHIDENTTATAAQAAIRIATSESTSRLLSIRVVPRYQLTNAPLRGVPRQDASGHEAILLVGVKELAPDVSFAEGAELLRFQVPGNARGKLIVEVDQDRGGVRSWSGEDLSPANSLLAGSSLDDGPGGPGLPSR